MTNTIELANKNNLDRAMVNATVDPSQLAINYTFSRTERNNNGELKEKEEIITIVAFFTLVKESNEPLQFIIKVYNEKNKLIQIDKETNYTAMFPLSSNLDLGLPEISDKPLKLKGYLSVENEQWQPLLVSDLISHFILRSIPYCEFVNEIGGKVSDYRLLLLHHSFSNRAYSIDTDGNATLLEVNDDQTLKIWEDTLASMEVVLKHYSVLIENTLLGVLSSKKIEQLTAA